MRRGSITVFLALALVLILSFVFSLLEGARVLCMKSRAQTVSDLCLQSMFGNYSTGLWEDYHLLFLDGTWQEGEFSMEKFVQRAMVVTEENLASAEGNLMDNAWDLTKMAPKDLAVGRYRLATDGEGDVFLNQVRLWMQREAVSDVLGELLSVKSQGETAEGQVKQKEEGWNAAWDALDRVKELKEQEADGQETKGQLKGNSDKRNVPGEQETNRQLTGDSDKWDVPGEQNATGQPAGDSNKRDESEEPPQAEMENPMDYVREVKASSVLSLVLKDPSQLSGKALADGNVLAKRQLAKGNWAEAPDSGLADRLCLQYYIQNYFSNYVAECEKGAKEKVLSYEMEYIIGGKTSDSENLEKVVWELLGIREAMNLVTILQDTKKKELAYGIAAAAAGFTGLPLLVRAVQIGVLLAWAFVESVLDIRTLLEGKKVPFLKRTDQWSSDLSNCRKNLEEHSEGKEEGEGLTYNQYLQMLLFVLSPRTISYRCMDLMERNEQIQMDAMIEAVEMTGTYQGRPLFWSMNFLTRQNWNSIVIPVSSSITYGEN